MALTFPSREHGRKSGKSESFKWFFKGFCCCRRHCVVCVIKVDLHMQYFSALTVCDCCGCPVCSVCCVCEVLKGQHQCAANWQNAAAHGTWNVVASADCRRCVRTPVFGHQTDGSFPSPLTHQERGKAPLPAAAPAAHAVPLLLAPYLCLLHKTQGPRPTKK